MSVQYTTCETSIRACYPVMAQLRPHLQEAAFMAQVQRQMANHDYRLAYLQHEGQVAAVSGFRFVEYLAWGKALYVDDLVTASSARKLGLAGQLLDHLIGLAQEAGCQQFHLDSGVQRHDAHRLYLGRKLQISSHHFSLELAPWVAATTAGARE